MDCGQWTHSGHMAHINNLYYRVLILKRSVLELVENKTEGHWLINVYLENGR